MSETLAEKLLRQGHAKDMREYQELKQAREMEVEATRKLKERLTKEHGDRAAREKMKSLGYDPDLRR